MDLTQLFKASVKTVRLRNKSVVFADKTRILKAKTRDEFSIKANDIRYQITQLRDLLIENRAAYMRFGIHLKSSTQMTDEERNIIDNESKKIILLCNKYLTDLKAECLKERNYDKKQVLEHQLAILDILFSYSNYVSTIHNEQKESRKQHEEETYKLLKLESNNNLYMDRNHFLDKHETYEQKKFFSRDNTNLSEKYNVSNSTTKILNTTQSDVAIDEDQSVKWSTDYENISSDDIQMLETENTQLLIDLKGLSEEVEEMGKNVVEIARLQEIFTEKVTVQKYDIERISNIVIGATENIKEANEQIKQSIQRNAGLRVWILFFLIIMSFSLLFLDWYND